MAFSRPACWNGRLGKTLMLHRGIGAIQNASDGRTVLGGKRGLFFEGLNDHGMMDPLSVYLGLGKRKRSSLVSGEWVKGSDWPPARSI